MQKAHELSHPVWIVTHADHGRSRTAPTALACAGSPPAIGSSSTSTIGPDRLGPPDQLRGTREIVGAEHDVHLWSSRPQELAVFLCETATDGDLHSRVLGLERLRDGPGFRRGGCPRSRGCSTCSGSRRPPSRGRLPVPSRRRRASPASRSESCSFIWQPKVRMWNVFGTAPV